MSTEEHFFSQPPDEDSDREHFNERELLMFEGWTPLDNMISSIDKADLVDWINTEIEGEENKIISLARTKEFSREGVQAWFMKTGRPESDVREAADIIATFYFEDGQWHPEESEAEDR